MGANIEFEIEEIETDPILIITVEQKFTRFKRFKTCTNLTGFSYFDHLGKVGGA